MTTQGARCRHRSILRDTCLDLGEVADIERDLHHPASALLDVVDDVVGGVWAPEADRNISARLGEGDGDRTTEATRCSGDEGGAASEVERLFNG